MRWESSAGNKHCYMLVGMRKGFAAAEQHCESLGGYLATITSGAEMEFISGFPLVHDYGDMDGPWIGYSDARIEGQWQWVNGEVGVLDNDVVYTNWAPDQPDNGAGGEDCAFLSGGSKGTLWSDGKCFLQKTFLCEKNN
eukprot:gnl/Spiro4/9363_TR4939_c0_g1_i1.p3 gnl/Spiro4/9363_TR4939_c0_g1~~gnl/Spiro4/9363_TR4939_c0_g1_i1.p3  ORF type:complete len:139 (+),score=45.20 gnl/Spiro4/9363_TR4939_c0_g1_i1:547-963(+)